MGDRVSMIETACRLMESRGLQIKRTSALFETAPMYVTEQDTFVNGVCEVSIFLYPQRLKIQQGLETLPPDHSNKTV